MNTLITTIGLNFEHSSGLSMKVPKSSLEKKAIK
jgi:hypothetical protein